MAVGLAENTRGQAELSVYPNPSDDFIHLRISCSVTCRSSLRICDLAGRVLMEKEISCEQEIYNMDISKLKPGVYIARTGGKGVLFIKKG